MEGFTVTGWLSFTIDDSHIDPQDIDALMAFDDASRDRVHEVVKAAVQRYGVIRQTGIITFTNANLVLHLARHHPERRTNYLDKVRALVADVEKDGLTVWGVLSVRMPEDPPGEFRTISLGRTKLVETAASET